MENEFWVVAGPLTAAAGWILVGLIIPENV